MKLRRHLQDYFGYVLPNLKDNFINTWNFTERKTHVYERRDDNQ